jgi:hypothetical protein
MFRRAIGRLDTDHDGIVIWLRVMVLDRDLDRRCAVRLDLQNEIPHVSAAVGHAEPPAQLNRWIVGVGRCTQRSWLGCSFHAIGGGSRGRSARRRSVIAARRRNTHNQGSSTY